ncbi:MAG: FkbM family methyltransferase [Candidatus Cloacimonetes bacterium HGW-Cloacimonetes-3]|jgi:FkbM family methyltransferase|nr:MAG: FkbM family methyltransferase [Candidatus Cloacimonetes bacterium HGW-Cloacimonetes-3]
MVLKLCNLIRSYRLKINGVLHIGAHYGEEYDTYKECGISKMYFFEPLPDNYQHLLDNIRKDFPSLVGYPQDLDIVDAQHNLHIKALNTALGNSTGVLPMYVETANQSQSSSLLKPKKHLEQYPHITFDQKTDVSLTKLDNLKVDAIYNMINIDVQGFELEVFKGAKATLTKQIDYIYTEVNRDELYENCPMIEELDTFLADLGFIRVITDWIGNTWGDALYIKRNLAPSSLVLKFIRFKFSKRGRKLLKVFLKS